MYYHGTHVGGLKELVPHGSNEGKYVYLTTNKLRVLPYCVNPIQVYCDKKYGKGKVNPNYRIAMFGVMNGRLCLKEIYPGYIKDSFKGQTAYIYSFDNANDVVSLGKPEVYGCPHSLEVESVEVIDDLYDRIEELEKEGKIIIDKFDSFSEEEKRKLTKDLFDDYLKTKNRYYKEFLFDMFPYIREEAQKREPGIKREQ